MKDILLSVSIISYNEESRIKLVLDSIKDIADEIIVVDSFSDDNTVSIAKEYGAKVFSEEWKGFTLQKNSSLEKCSGKWILCLDCDEEITKELSTEIKNIINSSNNNFSGYIINRKTKYLGKLLKYSWQPDNKLRLVKKDANPKWIGENVHESLSIEGNTSYLKNFLIHHSYKDITDHMNKTIKYAKLSATDYYKKGKKASILKLLFSPIFAFNKLYFLNKSFLDGVVGLIAAASAYIYAFLKYAYLWNMQKEKDKNDK